MLFFFRSILTQLFLNAYFIFRIKRSRPIHPFLKYIVYILIGCETGLFFIGLIGKGYLPSEYFTFIQVVNAFWSVSSIYFVVFLTLFDLIFYLNKKWVFYIRLKTSTLIFIDVIILLSFFFCVHFYLRYPKDGYLEPQIKTFSFQFDSTTNDTLDIKKNYKILMVSDMHLGYFINKTILQKYITVINAQQADIILINGDLIDYYLEPLEKERMDEELRKLQASQGVYFVPGNHEYKIDEEADFNWIRKTGIPVLRDSVVTLDDRLQLIGRDDRKNKDNRMEWDKLMAQTDSTKIRILISHQPGDIIEALPYSIPLILCGHTHDGQIFPGNGLCHFIHHNSYGLKKEGDSYSYTTSGLGLSGFPFRIGTESEVVIFNIEIY
jgi:predicted MPP superfamily phosphohydrolase